MNTNYILDVKGMGRGVFSGKHYTEGNVVEVCYLLTHEGPLDYEKSNILKHHALIEGKNRSAIILGYGSLYNHSFTPNTRTVLDWENKTLTYIATEPIGIDTQITFNYLFSTKDEAESWGITVPENITYCKHCKVLNDGSALRCANCNKQLKGQNDN